MPEQESDEMTWGELKEIFAAEEIPDSAIVTIEHPQTWEEWDITQLFVQDDKSRVIIQARDTLGKCVGHQIIPSG